MSLPALVSHTPDKCVFYQSAPVFLPVSSSSSAFIQNERCPEGGVPADKYLFKIHAERGLT